ncbi:TPA: Cd(II)/Pb(II)-responsive transcriptional regulator [Pseudomonas aeruginosa]|uniref:Cd(II)/Pb(II)-responsive transcriptional regulator n=1 Tax=Pseudomonas aeruginosa TaxID=287 RepID=UPI00071BB67D|nr:Cd(II)/Pb(II)-responsive transcriptional regulator [Pseudomonas aeruginosa]KSO03223.1 Cd(II)/Pb(II)-responsive transcriptional regulator [Pseudomonas aeruginosa]HCE8942719.1 Cd(II)/Pb(II)-responsive transcriptional regulator [Pseudomonas aeruginosa]HCF4375097.1 Cd(II)/Pb(II)-responsive transcriptional regulator [Pseudomonas aeruginosa]HCT4748191.1 Cd(II)/Pb(II)-responsive transcriptional regulator [Pseudomonas aeruginosa]HED8772187.1 Cd(II)/Pb(II)-responsive transcriptional regulator [Pseud
MKIGELAKRTGCPVETIRYYEREGLLPAPARSEGNYRQYTLAHVERLSFIRHCRSLDMTQEEIRTLLALRDRPEADCGTANRLIDEHLHHVEVRIAELQALREQLRDLGSRCTVAGNSQACGILRELEQPAPLSPIAEECAEAGHMHVPGVHRRHG